MLSRFARWLAPSRSDALSASERRYAAAMNDLKRAEEVLRHQEAYLSEALRLGRAGSFALDLRRRVYLHWSTGLFEIFGFDPALGVPAGQQIWDRIHPDDLAWVRAEREHELKDLRSRDVQYRIIRLDGTLRHIHVVGSYIRDLDGTPTEMVGIVMDVTERKVAEAALRKTEERHALAMKASEAGYWDWNLATGEYYVSDRLLEMARLPTDTSFESRADSLARVPLHPDDRKMWAEAVQTLFAGNGDRLQMDLRSVFPGETRWSHLHGMCVRDANGKVVRWSGSSTDITDRKRAEEGLRSRQEMLELAQNAAHAVAFDWRIDARDGENRWSAELEAMFGLAPGNFDGTFKAWKKLVVPEDWPAVREAVIHASVTGDVAAEYRVIHPGGVVRWLQAKGKLLSDAGGKPIRMVGFMLDVTDRHEAEDELRRLEKQLRQAQRLEAMGTLAGGIAHDFNNILGAILGYGEMALRDAPKGSRLQRDLEAINAAGDRGRALVDRILAFSRSAVGERVPVHVERVARETLDLLSAKLPGNVTVKASLRCGRAAIQGDATQVHQVLMNLVTNAAQAMPEGGLVRLSADVRRLDDERIVTTGRLPAGGYVVLEVADEGKGIAAGVLERIFDPFFTTKEVGVGTGLGLSLVHGIVAEVGGAIDVATEVGKGCVFTVYMPHIGDAAEDQDIDDQDMPRGVQQRVLVVDDEESLVQLTTRSLAELGYAPVGFTSSSAALEAFRASPAQFDAVITDERMPGLSGSALIGQVRSIRRDIPILLVSGHVGGSIVDRAYNAGADEVLKKPISARDLATTLARMLQG